MHVPKFIFLINTISPSLPSSFADEPGEYNAKIPVILGQDKEHPYQYLHLKGILKSPQLEFDPLAIVLTPVPLSTKVAADFTINAAGFKK